MANLANAQLMEPPDGPIDSHTHVYQQRPANGNKFGNKIAVNNQTSSPTSATGGNQGHSYSVSGGGGSFSGNNMSHSRSLSGGLNGSGSLTGGSYNFNVQYIDMIVCRKLSNPG